MSSTPVFVSNVTAYGTPNNFGPSINQRLNPSVARFQQAIEAFSQSLRVAIPAVVQSFNPGVPNVSSATVTVKIAIMDPFQWNVNGPDGPVNIQVTPVTPGVVLTDVPIGIPTAGGWSLTMPIAAGDECQLIFNDACIDSWYQSGGTDNNPVVGFRHNLSDATAWFGLRSVPRALLNYSTDSCQLRSDDGTVLIDLNVNTGQITITAPTVIVNSTTATVNASGTATVDAATATVHASGTVTVSGADVNVSATGTLALSASTVTIFGSTAISIGGTAALTLNGKNFNLHSHTGVTTGGGVTGPVF